MPDWFDLDAFATPCRGPNRFAIVPKFWDFLEQKAAEGVIASPLMVLKELEDGHDELKSWAKNQTQMFKEPDDQVQGAFSRVVVHVNENERYSPQHRTKFLGGADPWLIAHAMAAGGRVITFEKPEPQSRKPKIPDVAGEFELICVQLWDLLSELGWST